MSLSDYVPLTPNLVTHGLGCMSVVIPRFLCLFLSLILSELCGTPGYLAPEVLAHSMYENVAGYGKEVDMYVIASRCNSY